MIRTRHIRPALRAWCGSALALLAGMAVAMAQEPSPEAIVDAMEKVSGTHAGKRRSGAKGVCAAGEFVATGGGARLTTAVPFQPGNRVPVVARFSNGGGNPRAPDNGPTVRGMSLAFTLPGNDSLEMVMINVPAFTASNLDSFMRLLASRVPDPTTGAPDPQRIAAADRENSEWAVQPNCLRTNSPPSSYATAPYFSVNSFVFQNAAGEKRHARWTFEPVAGRVGLTPEERAARGVDFLQDELRERVGRAPAEWRMVVQLPREGDPLLSATAIWPADREQVEVGLLRITGRRSGGRARGVRPGDVQPRAAARRDRAFRRPDPAHTGAGLRGVAVAALAVRRAGYSSRQASSKDRRGLRSNRPLGSP
jgi:catalase